MNILFAASEAFPFMKTGGLGDVVHSLPEALAQHGNDVRLVLPAYRDVLESVDNIRVLDDWEINGTDGLLKIRLLQAHEDVLGDYLYLIDVPELFDRPGNPYVNPEGNNWPDNAVRFTVFCRAVTRLAGGTSLTGWRPDIVHCHDWQTGLVPAFLSISEPKIKTVFTIHNMAYDGYYTHDDFVALGLPGKWWSPEYIEFYGGFSMLKAGMVFADHVTTVSPTYAREICTPEYGYGFEGVLQSMGKKLTGILNGIDLDVWNPEYDPYISHKYSVNHKRIAGKQANKISLQKVTGLPEAGAPLLGFIGRLVEQKGIDLIINIAPDLFESTDAMMIILGTGDASYEKKLLELASDFPGRMHVHIGYSEELAHQIEAGCDLFIMPSRFEPCGLNQMYSLRYGTPPVVNYTGGLADTVVDTNSTTISNNSACGFVFYNSEQEAFFDTLKRAIKTYRQPRTWQKICRTAMLQDHGWDSSASEYIELYKAEIEIV